ncbi:hypothetical protein Tco_1055153, partial [Tanacetum coccineum]
LLTKAFDSKNGCKNMYLQTEVGNEAVHKELGERMERAATTASSLEAEKDSDAQTRFEAASKSPLTHLSQELTHLEVGTDRLRVSTARHILLLLGKVSTDRLRQTAALSTLEDGVVGITATIDRTVKVLVSEASIRRHLKIDDSEVQHQDEEPSLQTTPESSPSRITSSPSLSPQYTLINAPSTSQPPVTEEAASMFHESPLQSVHSLGRDEGSLSLYELTVMCTSLSKKVESLESELKDTKQTYNAALTKLIKRVKKLEQTVKTSQSRKRARLVLSDDEEEDAKIQEKNSADTEILLEEEPTELVEDFGSGEKGEKEIRIADVPDSTASVIPEISTAIPERQVYIRRSVEKRKDKGKAIMKEDELVQKKSKKHLEQERLGQEQKKAEADPAHDIDWSDPAVIRYHTLQNRPFYVVESKKNMCMYLKNQGGYKMSHFKGMSYEDIRPIFERVFKKAGGSRKKTLTRKRAGENQSEECAKRQKTKYEKEKEELRLSLKITPDDDSELLGKKGAKDMEVCKLTRAHGSSSYHGDIQAFLKRLDRQDLNDLYSLVQERFQDYYLEGHDLLLWGDLKMIFDPDESNELWMNQLDWKLMKWKLYENCGVHTMFIYDTPMEINMLVEKKYPLIKEILKKMLSLQLEAEEESTMAFKLIKFFKSLLEE